MLHYSRLARFSTRLLALVAAFVLISAVQTHADTIVSSLNNTSSVVNFSIGAWAGSPFTTDAQSWTMTSAAVTLELGALDVSTANVRLFADAGGKPGASLADLGTKTVTDGSQLYTFTAPASVALAPSTTYWIAVGNVGTNGGLNVRLSMPGGSFTNTGVAGASMGFSISSGGGVGTQPPTNWVASSPGVALLFAVDGSQQSAVPPTLMITLAGKLGAYVTWPTNYTGYTLESATNLPATAWATVPTAPAIMGSQYAVLVTNTAPRIFYRLRKP